MKIKFIVVVLLISFCSLPIYTQTTPDPLLTVSDKDGVEPFPNELSERELKYNKLIADETWQVPWDLLQKTNGIMRLLGVSFSKSEHLIELPDEFESVHLIGFMNEKGFTWFRFIAYSHEKDWAIIFVCSFSNWVPQIDGNYYLGEQPSMVKAVIIGPELEGRRILYEGLPSFPEQNFVIDSVKEAIEDQGPIVLPVEQPRNIRVPFLIVDPVIREEEQLVDNKPQPTRQFDLVYGKVVDLNLKPLSHDGLPDIKINVGKFSASWVKLKPVPVPETLEDPKKSEAPEKIEVPKNLEPSTE